MNDIRGYINKDGLRPELSRLTSAPEDVAAAYKRKTGAAN